MSDRHENQNRERESRLIGSLMSRISFSLVSMAGGSTGPLPKAITAEITTSLKARSRQISMRLGALGCKTV